MKRSRQPAGANRDEPRSPPPARPAARRRWGFRLAAACGIPFLLLAVVEVGLRLTGYGYPTGFWARHPAVAGDRWVDNQRYSFRFFPRTLARHPEPRVVSGVKPADVHRILVFGESAAIGDPAPAFGFSRILAVLLHDRYPNARFEVINVAFTAINSHVILPIARDCRPLGADFWLIYLGNNEVIGPFGAGTIFGNQSLPLPAIRAGLALKTLRLGQLLGDWVPSAGASSEAARGWGGMSMFLGQQVRQDDVRLEAVRSHFERNLREMIDLGTGSGARVVVSTMVSRVRDWPPFASLHRLGLTASQLADWEHLYQSGGDVATKDSRIAVEKFAQAAALDGEYADLQFRWSEACRALGDEAGARTHALLARDLDTLRFRTDSRLNDAIRTTVAAVGGNGVRLLDAEAEFARRSPGGLPGAEWLYEHVHFKFPGNYLLARLFAEQLAPWLDVPAAAARDWLPLEACAARLGFNDVQRFEVLKLIQRRFEEAIYRGQLGYSERMAALQKELGELRGQGKPEARRRAVEACRRALASTPDDWELHELTARLLAGLDDVAGAVAEWREVARLIPHAARSYVEPAKLFVGQGRLEEAAPLFEQALRVNPDAAEAMAGLGLVAVRRTHLDEAGRWFQRALRVDPAQREAIDGLAQLAAGRPRPRGTRRRRVRTRSGENGD